MGKTSIEWTDETWNPVLGCRRKSPGCLHCYAERLIATRMSKNPKLPMYHDIARLTDRGEPQFTGAHRVVASRLDEPLRARKGRRYFVCDMGDLFFEGHPLREIAAVFGVMAAAPQHVFQVLTKRPERVLAFYAWLDRNRDQPHAVRCGVEAANRGADVDYLGLPDAWPLPNVWVGTSVENQEAADERIPHLLRIPARVRFLSLEPLLEQVHVAPHLGHGPDEIAWIIVGGESGPHARPCAIEWIEDLLLQARAADVAAFVKQAGSLRFGGSFATFDTWVNKARSWIGGTGAKCFDAKLRPCSIGADFMRARDEGAFPVTFWGPWRHPKGGDPAEWPEHLRVRELPGDVVAPAAPPLSSAVEEVFGP